MRSKEFFSCPLSKKKLTWGNNSFLLTSNSQLFRIFALPLTENC